MVALCYEIHLHLYDVVPVLHQCQVKDNAFRKLLSVCVTSCKWTAMNVIIKCRIPEDVRSYRTCLYKQACINKQLKLYSKKAYYIKLVKKHHLKQNFAEIYSKCKAWILIIFKNFILEVYIFAETNIYSNINVTFCIVQNLYRPQYFVPPFQ